MSQPPSPVDTVYATAVDTVYVEAVALPTRDHLVATARRLLDAEGLEPLTLREIARRGGLSHGAPLRHFPSLATLLSAVAAQGFRELMDAVDAAVAEARASATPLERLAAAGRGYVRFALGSPGVFALMFRPERLDPSDAELPRRRHGRVRPAPTAGRRRPGMGLSPRRLDDPPRRRRLGIGTRARAALAPGRAAGRRGPRAGAYTRIMNELMLGVRADAPRPRTRRRRTSR